MTRAVLFDLDGTLVDSRADIAAAANRALAAWSLPALEPVRVEGFIGWGGRHLVERCLEAAGGPTDGDAVRSFLETFLADYAGHLVDRTRPYPGVSSTLRALRAAGLALGVVTNKPEGLARPLVERLELGPFDVLVGGDSLTARKPDPLPLTTALERLGVPAEQALYVGDSAIDLETARAARVPFVGVAYGIGSVEDLRAGRAERIVERFDELLDGLVAAPGSAPS